MRVLAIALAACVLNAAPDDVKKAMQLLEGNWSMISGEADGFPLPPDLVKNAKRVVRDAVTTVHIGGQLFMKAKFTVDTSQKPKSIDYLMLDGPTKGKKQLGIFELNGERVKFCFSAPGRERPTEFKGGPGITLSVWQRAKSTK